MNIRHAKDILFLSALFLVLVTKFQNCEQVSLEQSGENSTTINSSVGDDNPPVNTIDPQIQWKLVLDEDYVELEDSATTTIFTGLCDERQDGALLKWRVLDIDSVSVLEGHVQCGQGGFTLELSKLQNLECGLEHTLRVSLGARTSDTMVVYRRCRPAMKQEAPVQSAQFKLAEDSSCYYELDDDGCYLSCYSEGQLTDEQQMDFIHCEAY